LSGKLKVKNKMMIDLSGKTALMTGGMNQLAGGVARCLHDAGASIIFGHIGQDADAASKLAAEVGGRTAILTLDDPAMLRTEIAALGPMQIAVVSPAWMNYGAFLETTSEDWDAVLSRNFEQATWAAQVAAHQMIAQGNGGRIIFLSSVAAMMPFTERIAAGTSLAAIRAMAKMAAVDLGPHRITVNVVAAGWIEAEWTAKYLTPAGRAYVEKGIPAGVYWQGR
jgi:NAD(P)-dependent dehydrogenase (short-subunit alcohol dehydrogenase family)